MTTIEWSPQAQIDIRKLDRAVARRILTAVDRYAETGHGDIVRLKGQGNEYRLRVGDWRVRFRVGVPGFMEILRVLHRRQAYR